MNPIITTLVTSALGSAIIPWLVSKGINLDPQSQSALITVVNSGLVGLLTGAAHWIHVNTGTDKTPGAATKAFIPFALLILGSILTTSGLSGCAGAPVKPISIPVIPPAQLAAQVCPIIKADLLLLESPAGAALLSPAQQAKITNTIVPANDAVCAAGATVDLTDLQKFNDTIFPALIQIVSAVPAIPNQPAVLLGLTLAQPILGVIVQQAIAASQATPAAPAPAARP